MTLTLFIQRATTPGSCDSSGLWALEEVLTARDLGLPGMDGRGGNVCMTSALPVLSIKFKSYSRHDNRTWNRTHQAKTQTLRRDLAERKLSDDRYQRRLAGIGCRRSKRNGASERFGSLRSEAPRLAYRIEAV